MSRMLAAYGASHRAAALAHLCKQAAMDTRSFIGRSWLRLGNTKIYMWCGQGANCQGWLDGVGVVRARHAARHDLCIL